MNEFSKKIILAVFLILSLNSMGQKNQKFIIILDAGHGGKDPGNSYHGFVEKQIALETTLKVEKYLEMDKDIQVIFTRTTDVFVELINRPKIANKADANLFVSIHCNSVKDQSPYGTETFVMGLARSNTNLEVAKNENSVILLEKDYKETYKGFDPKNPETLIGLKILQEEYLNRSIILASKVEDNFVNKLNRKSRGVKQIPLWVLDASYMPSVLIELGFLSNKKEGEYLNSEEGQNDMAKAIADAIISYKNEYFWYETSNKVDEKPSQKVLKNEIKDVVIPVKKEEIVITEEPRKVKELDPNGIIFKVQIFASSRKIDLSPNNFNGLKNISMSSGKSINKYMYEETSDYNEAKKYLEEAKEKGYSSAFLIALKDGKNIHIQDALK